MGDVLSLSQKDKAPTPTDTTGQAAKPEHHALDDMPLFLRAMAYSGLQSPINALAQIADHFGANLEPHLQFINAPEAGNSFLDKATSTVGSSIGMLVPYALGGAASKNLLKLGAGDEALARLSMSDEAISTLGTSEAATARLATAARIGTGPLSMSVKESALTGAITGLVLTPTQQGQNFWESRAYNSMSSAATLSLMTASALKLKSFGKEVPPFKSDAAVSAISGLPAGALSTQMDSLVQSPDHKFASFGQTLQGAATMSVLGGAFGAIHDAGTVKNYYSENGRFPWQKGVDTPTAQGDTVSDAAKVGATQPAGTVAPREFKIVGNQDALDKLRSGDNSSAMLKVRELVGKGLFGREKLGSARTLYVQQMADGGSTNLTAAQEADIIAMCKAGTLPADLQSKAAIANPDQMFIASGLKSDRIVISGEQPANSKWSMHLGDSYGVSDFANEPPASIKEFASVLTPDEFSQLAHSFVQDGSALAPEQANAMREALSTGIDRIGELPAAQQRATIADLTTVHENDPEALLKLYNDLNNQRTVPFSELGDLQLKVLEKVAPGALRSPGNEYTQRGVYIGAAKAAPEEGHPALLRMLLANASDTDFMEDHGGANGTRLFKSPEFLKLINSLTPENLSGYTDAEQTRIINRLARIGYLRQGNNSSIDDSASLSEINQQMLGLSTKQLSSINSQIFLELKNDLISLNAYGPEGRADKIHQLALAADAQRSNAGNVSLDDFYSALLNRMQPSDVENLDAKTLANFSDALSGTQSDKPSKAAADVLLKESTRRLQAGGLDSADEKSLLNSIIDLKLKQRDADLSLEQFAQSLQLSQLDLLDQKHFERLVANVKKSKIGDGSDSYNQEFVQRLLERSSQFAGPLSTAARNNLIGMVQPETIGKLSADQFSGLERNLHEVLNSRSAAKDPETMLKGEFAVTNQMPLDNAIQAIADRRMDLPPLDEDQIDSALSQFKTPAERNAALKTLEERSGYLSYEGMQKPLQELGQQLEPFVKVVPRDGRIGLYSRTIDVLVSGESTQGKALAYEFRKATGIGVQIHVLKPGAVYTGGHMVMFDPAPEPGSPLYETYQKAVNTVDQNDGAPRVIQPAYISDFYRGPNLFDALGSTDGGTQFADAWRESVPKPSNSLVRSHLVMSVDPADAGRVSDALSGFDARRRQVLRDQTELFLAHNTIGKKVTPDLLANLLAKPELNDHMTPRQVMDGMRGLNANLKGTLAAKNKSMDDVVYVTNADRQGSSQSYTYLYRLANGLEGAQHDGQFLPISAIKGNADGKVVVYLDDAVYSGDSATRKAKVIANAAKVPPENIIVGALTGYQEGLNFAKGEGVNVVTANPEPLKDVYQQVRAMLATGEIKRTLATQASEPSAGVSDEDVVDAVRKVMKTGWDSSNAWDTRDDPEGSAPQVTAHITMPSMVANNVATLTENLAKYQGLSGQGDTIVKPPENPGIVNNVTEISARRRSPSTTPRTRSADTRARRGVVREGNGTDDSDGDSSIAGRSGSTSDSQRGGTSDSQRGGTSDSQRGSTSDSQRGSTSDSTAGASPYQRVLGAPLQDFANFWHTNFGVGTEGNSENVNFAMRYLLSERPSSDPQWIAFSHLASVYENPADPAHAQAVDMVDTAIAATSLGANSAPAEELREMVAPTDKPADVQTGIDLILESHFGDPSWSVYSSALRQVLNAYVNVNSSAHQSAEQIIQGMLAG